MTRKSRSSVVRACALLLVFLVIGCGHSGGGGGTDIIATDIDAIDGKELPTDDGTISGLPVAACGMTPYHLKAGTEVGKLLEWERVDVWVQDTGTFEIFLSAAGLDHLKPVQYGFEMYRFRYTTQDRGEIVEATATLTIPDLDETAPSDRPTILNVHGTSGWSDPCAPSADPMNVHNVLAAYPASQGYLSVSPDHIGLAGFHGDSSVRHAYLGGEQIAIGSWDAVRAARVLLEDKLETATGMDGRVVPYGSSQGGHGVLFAGLYAPYYAPEFEMPAVVAVVPLVSIHYMAEYFASELEHTTPGILATALGTMREWYGSGSLPELFTNVAPDFHADSFIQNIFQSTTCPLGFYPDPQLPSHEALFTSAFLDAAREGRWEDIEPWGCFLDENSLTGTSVSPLIHVPTLVAFGEEDRLVPPGRMKDDLEALCASGYQIDYLECALANHSETVLWSIPEHYAWLAETL